LCLVGQTERLLGLINNDRSESGFNQSVSFFIRIVYKLIQWFYMTGRILKVWFLTALLVSVFSNDSIAGNNKTEENKTGEIDQVPISARDAEAKIETIIWTADQNPLYFLACQDTKALVDDVKLKILRIFSPLVILAKESIVNQTTDSGNQFTLVYSDHTLDLNNPDLDPGPGWEAPNQTIWYSVSDTELTYEDAEKVCKKAGRQIPKEEDFKQLKKEFNELPRFLSDQRDHVLWTSEYTLPEAGGFSGFNGIRRQGTYSWKKRSWVDIESMREKENVRFVSEDADGKHRFCCIKKPNANK
jgi:hypothetical protein